MNYSTCLNSPTAKFPKFLVGLFLVLTTLHLGAQTPPSFELKWGRNGGDGTSGNGDGEFSSPFRIAVDSSGNVYVADTNNHRIQKFNSSGAFLTKWGASGTGDGEFNTPRGIAVDSSGNVYVVDSFSHRIQKFDSSGVFSLKWGASGGDGTSGTGDGEFSSPSGIAVDSSGNVYVADLGNRRIQKFNSSGGFSLKWGADGSSDGQFSVPSDVAVDSSGNVYVADTNNNRIQKFDSSGGFSLKWGASGGDGTLGSGDGEFWLAEGIGVDSSDNVYVADLNNSRVQKFDSSGAFLTKWGTFGTANGQFKVPRDVAVDSSGNVYVSDSSNHHIQKFSGPIPVANDDATSVSEGGTVSALNGGITSVLVNDTAFDKDTLTVSTTPVNGPSHGTLTLAGDGTFTYTHDGTGLTTDSFDYEISDGSATDTATVTITVIPSPVVTIPDSALEQAIRDELVIPTGDLREANMANLISLSATELGITDLTGLETAVNLTGLTIWGNQISNLGPLTGLTSLTDLDLGNNQISDLNPLANLTGLLNLFIGGNLISDISPLNGLTALSALHFWGNQVSDLSTLIGLTALTELDIGDNLIVSLTPLSNLPSLNFLYLYNNQISDLGPLNGLTTLISLNLDSNQISDLSALSGLTSLTDLSLIDNQINDISALSGLTSLGGLALDINQISDISALSGLTSLGGLGLGSNQISDISALSGLTSLTDLSLDSNQISDISVLSGLTSLEWLGLLLNQINDISALSGLTSLTDLLLQNNQISDISPLSGLSNLTRLELFSNQIRDISPLSGLTGLEVILVNDNLLYNIDALAGLTNPVEVEVNNNFLIVSDGSSARLVIDALDSISANPVIYEPQNDLFAGLPLVDDLNDALEPVWFPLENGNPGVIDLVETPVGLSLIQNGPNTDLSVDLPFKGYVPVDRDWQAEVRSHIDPLALPSRGPGANFETARVGFKLSNNSDPTDFLFNNGEVSYDTDGADIFEDGPAVVVGGFTNNVADADFGRVFHGSTELVLRLLWDSVAQTLTSVYILEDGSLWELARVDLGNMWGLQPGGTFTLALQGFTNTDLVIAPETVYLMDFKAEGFVPLQDTVLLDDLKDVLEPIWSDVESSDISAIDLVEGANGLNAVHFNVLDTNRNSANRTLQAVAPFDDNWQVEMNVSAPNPTVGLTSVELDDWVERIEFRLRIFHAQHPDNRAFLSYGHTAFRQDVSNIFPARELRSLDFTENPDLQYLFVETRELNVPDVILRVSWDSSAQLLRLSYEADGVLFDFGSINPVERWGMQHGSTFEIAIGTSSSNTQLVLPPGELFGMDFAAGGVSFFDDPVDVPDPGLEGAIRDELGIPTDPLTVGDLNFLTFLDAADRNIADLTGLEAAHNLEVLNLSGNQISDLHPLSGLTVLNDLNLGVNQIVDLNPLGGLGNLTILYLDSNRIVDIKPLENLTEMQRLFLGGNNIFSINTLAGLANLLEVNVEDNFLDLRGGSEALDVIDQLIIAGADPVVYEPQRDPFEQLEFLDALVNELDPALWEFGTTSDNHSLLELVETPSGLSFIQNGPRDNPSERLVTKQLKASPPFDSDWSAAVEVNLGHVDFGEIGERTGMEFTLFNSAILANLFHAANHVVKDDGFGNPVLEQRIDVGNISVFGFLGFDGINGIRQSVSGDYFTLYLFWIAESQTLVMGYEVDGVFSAAVTTNLGSVWIMGPGDTFTLNLAGFTEAHTEVGPEVLFFNNFSGNGLNIHPTGSVSVNLDPGSSDFREGMQWRVNGQDWQPSGATVFGIDVGEALIEYRPVLGFEVLPEELVYVDENVDNFVDRPIFALSGTFGAFDPNYALPEFKGETYPVRAIPDGNGGILVSWSDHHNVDGVRTGSLVRLHDSDGSVDPNFNFGPQLNATGATAVQADGNILVTGSIGRDFSNRLLRVFPDGSPDNSFNAPSFFGNGIRMLTVQPDGRILVGGLFTEVDGMPVSGLVRLNNDGSLDESFNIPTFDPGSTLPNPNYPSIGIWAPIVLDGAGNIYIGGNFGAVDGEPREGFARLDPDGFVDVNYSPAGYALNNNPGFSFTINQGVRGLGLQSNGSAVIGGNFVTDAQAEAVLLRFDANGDIDAGFNLVQPIDVGLTSLVRKLVILGDDSVVAVENTVFRVEANGTLDATFSQPVFTSSDPVNLPGRAFWLDLLPDGRLVVAGGDFLADIDGTPVPGMAVLDGDGNLDPGFTPGPFQRELYPEDFALQSDGSVYVRGDFFTQVGNDPRLGLARFDAQGNLDASMDLDSVVTDLESTLGMGLTTGGQLYFTADSSTAGRVLGRLLPDGTEDTGFAQVNVGGGEIFIDNSDQPILKDYQAGQSEADGLSGVFTRYDGTGVLDNTFIGLSNQLDGVFRDPTSDGFPDGPITSIWAVEPKILAELSNGTFLAQMGGGASEILLVRLLDDGSRDGTFNEGVVWGGNPSVNFPEITDPLRGGEIVEPELSEQSLAGFTDVVELADGSILVSGQFDHYNGHYSPGLVRIFATGTVDTDFSIGDGAQFSDGSGGLAKVDSISVDGDDGIWLSGNFERFDYAFVQGLVLLHSDGSVDTSFAPNVNYFEWSDFNRKTDLALAADGSVYVLGQFQHEGDPWPFALTHLIGKGSVSVHFDAGPDDVPGGFQWRVNGGPWQGNGEVLLDVPEGDALVEYRPVLGYAEIPSEEITVTFGGEVFLNPVIQALGGTFGAFDQSFNLPEFKGESFPTRVISDGNGGLLVTWASFHNVNNVKTGALIRLHESDGSLDENFNFGPQLRFTLASTVQDDGMILVSGGSGSPLADGTVVNLIRRVFPDGRRDFSFRSPVFNGGVRILKAQPDGKVLAGGLFTEVDGMPVGGLVRLNDDGSLDGGFQIPELVQHPTTGFQNGIWAPIVLDDEGGIYIGGSFGTVNGEPREGFARLHPDGNLDLNYGVGGYVMTGGRPVRGIGFQSDGSLIIGGRFEDDFGNEAVLIRLDPDGVFDPAFNLVSRGDSGLFRQTRILEVMDDDRIVAGGGTIARFNSDGSLDGSFLRPVFESGVGETFWLDVLQDGSVVFTGDGGPTAVNGEPLAGMGRLLSNGIFDSSFTPGSFQTEWYPQGLAVQSDGRTVVWAGFENIPGFDRVGSEPRNGLARFDTDGLLDSNYDLALVNADLHWLVDAGMLLDDRLYYIAQSDGGLVYGRLDADGTADNSFTPAAEITGSDVFVLGDDRAIFYQSDDPQGIVDGNVGGFQRVNLNGSLDVTFTGPVLNIGSVDRAEPSQDDIAAGFAGPINSITTAPVKVLVELAGGKLLVMVPNDGGGMKLVRLDVDGSLDNTFISGNIDGGALNLDFPFITDPLRGGEELQQAVFSPALAGFMDAVELNNGSILVSGQFEFYEDHYSPGLVKLSANGSIDLGFNIGDGAERFGVAGRVASVNGITVDGDGKIWLTGAFNVFNSAFAPGIVNLFSDGSVDTHFLPEIRYRDFVTGQLETSVQSDGSGGLYVLGQYRHDGDPWPFGLSRLIATGTVSVDFDAGGAEIPGEFQWRVNGGPWQDNGSTVLGVPVGEAHIEFRPVLGYEVLSSQFVQVGAGGQIVLAPPVQVLATTFGDFDPGFIQPEFKRRGFPARLTADGSGGVLVSGFSNHNADGVRTGTLVRLNEVTGLLDDTFEFGPQLHDTFPNAVQADGKILVSGTIGGSLDSGIDVPNQVLRVSDLGLPDPSFNSPLFTGGGVRILAIQQIGPEEKVLVGGLFTEVDGMPVSGLVRLNDDGSLDESFHIPFLGEHPNQGIFTTGIWAPFALDGDGKILIGGIFGAVDGFPREGFARLNEDGTLDTLYPADGFSIAGGRPVRGIGIQSDGKVVIGGRLNTDDLGQVLLVRLDLNGNRDLSFNLLDRFSPDINAPLFVQVRKLEVLGGDEIDKIVVVDTTVIRFNADGSLDGTFNQPEFDSDAFEPEDRPLGEAFWIEPLSNGRMAVASGDFLTLINGVPVPGIAVLNSNGTLDTNFTPPSFEEELYPENYALQSDGKVYVNGDFTSVNNEPRRGLARLEVDGSLDTAIDLSTFVPDLQRVTGMGLMSDDRLYVIAGSGFDLNDNSPVYLRLSPNGSIDTSFNPDSSLNGRELFVQSDDRAIIDNYERGISELNGLEGVFTRLNVDGSIDDSFVGLSGFDDVTVEREESTDQFAVGPVTAIWSAEPEILTQLDNGQFIAMLPGPRPFTNLARLNTDGTVDDSFTIGEIYAGEGDEFFPSFADPLRGGEELDFPPPLIDPDLAGFTDAVELPDGSILVSGQFTEYNGHYSPGLVRLFADGSIDFDFYVGNGAESTFSADRPARVDNVNVDDGGAIYLTGGFDIFNDAFAAGIVKLHSNGDVDRRFAPGIGLIDFVSNSLRNGLILNPDGSALVTGQYQHDGDPWPFALSRLGTTVISWDLNVDAASGGFVEGDGTFADQFNAEINAFPAQGYSFTGWTGTGVEDPGSPTTTVLMTEDRNVTATFEFNTNFVTRTLPGGYIPGQPFTVIIEATPDAGVNAYAVEDSVPEGWTVSNINLGGVFDDFQSKVKFGPFFDNTMRTFSYDITPPGGTTGEFIFSGLGSADGADSLIAGDDSVNTGGTHPADLSPEDFIMAIGEVTAYGAAWQVGDVWPRDPNPIDIDFVTRAGFLWKNGENYQFDPAVADPPLWWVNSETPGSLGKPAGALVGNTATGSLPISTVPDQPFTVTVEVSPTPDIAVYAVEDVPPAGWSIGDISDGGSYDAVNHLVKWLFLDNQARTLTYEAIPPVGTSSGTSFSGIYSFDGYNDAVLGQRALQDKPAAQSFDNWAVEKIGFTVTAEDDFSEDGINNLLTYALGLDPTQKNNGKLPVSELETDGQGNAFITLIYTRNKKASGVDYMVESSTDLTVWNLPQSAQTTVVGEDASSWTVKVSIPISQDEELFLRLKVQPVSP